MEAVRLLLVQLQILMLLRSVRGDEEWLGLLRSQLGSVKGSIGH